MALATMVEVVYKQQLDEYLKKNNTPVKLREYLKKNTDRISKYSKLFKKLGIEYHDKDIKDKIMSIRNRVIHANYQTTGKEALNAYTAGCNFLKEYRILMFIKTNKVKYNPTKLHKTGIYGNKEFGTGNIAFA